MGRPAFKQAEHARLTEDVAQAEAEPNMAADADAAAPARGFALAILVSVVFWIALIAALVLAFD